MEVWKQVEGYENYKVSSHGRLRNTKTRTYLNGSADKRGYIIMGLSKQNKCRNYVLHRLIAQAFIENPERKEIVKHRDGNNGNNNVTNLYWMSFAEVRANNGHIGPGIETIYKM